MRYSNVIALLAYVLLSLLLDAADVSACHEKCGPADSSGIIEGKADSFPLMMQVNFDLGILTTIGIVLGLAAAAAVFFNRWWPRIRRLIKSKPAPPPTCIECRQRPAAPGRDKCEECLRPKPLCIRCQKEYALQGFDKCSNCMQVKYCMWHGESIPTANKSCPNTGERLLESTTDVKRCSNSIHCKAYIPIQAKFCEVCGTRQPEVAETSQFREYQAKSNEVCYIDKWPIESHQKAVRCSRCNTIFHDGCIETWMQLNQTCKGCSDKISVIR